MGDGVSSWRCWRYIILIMKYKIKNLTYSVLRILINNRDIRFEPRKYSYTNIINEDILRLEKKGFIKVKEVK